MYEQYFSDTHFLSYPNLEALLDSETSVILTPDFSLDTLAQAILHYIPGMPLIRPTEPMLDFYVHACETHPMGISKTFGRVSLELIGSLSRVSGTELVVNGGTFTYSLAPIPGTKHYTIGAISKRDEVDYLMGLESAISLVTASPDSLQANSEEFDECWHSADDIVGTVSELLDMVELTNCDMLWTPLGEGRVRIQPEPKTQQYYLAFLRGYITVLQGQLLDLREAEIDSLESIHDDECEPTKPAAETAYRRHLISLFK